MLVFSAAFRVMVFRYILYLMGYRKDNQVEGVTFGPLFVAGTKVLFGSAEISKNTGKKLQICQTPSSQGSIYVDACTDLFLWELVQLYAPRYIIVVLNSGRCNHGITPWVSSKCGIPLKSCPTDDLLESECRNVRGYRPILSYQNHITFFDGIGKLTDIIQTFVVLERPDINSPWSCTPLIKAVFERGCPEQVVKEYSTLKCCGRPECYTRRETGSGSKLCTVCRAIVPKTVFAGCLLLRLRQRHGLNSDVRRLLLRYIVQMLIEN